MEKFEREENGYNRSQVNQVLEEVITKTQGIITKCQKQTQEIEALKRELEQYQARENVLKQAILNVEMNGETSKRLAREEAKNIIEEAKTNASRIINEALLEAEKVEIQNERMKKNLKVFKKKLKLVMEQQMTVVEEIDTLEMDP